MFLLGVRGVICLQALGVGRYRTKGTVGLDKYSAISFCREHLRKVGRVGDCPLHLPFYPFYTQINILYYHRNRFITFLAW